MSLGQMGLAQRSAQAERMDTDCSDFDDYARCLRDLSRVNMVTMTHRPMLRWLAQQVGGDGMFSLLDVACGHGDALRAIRRRYPTAELTGIDLNAWAIRAAMEATDPAANIAYLNDNAFSYAPAAPFDFIITSQFTHHLTDQEVVDFLIWVDAHARRGWFISDLHRHVISYLGFPLLARAAGWHRFVREDGQISIARSFVRAEWDALLARAGIATNRARASWHIPFRLCVGSR